MSTETKSRRPQRSKPGGPAEKRSGPSPDSVKSVGSSAGRPRTGRFRHVHLFILICLVYLCTLTDKAFDWIGDGQVMFDTAVSLHEFGELGISTEPVQDLSEGGGTSDYYGKYGLGLSIVEQLPLLLVTPIERTFGEGRSNVLFPVMNLVLTALTALLVALGLRDLGFRLQTQLLAAIGFAFATPAWAYVSYDFSEPLQALCLAAAFWFSVRVKGSGSPSFIYPVSVGFSLGFAVLSKEQLLILIPAYAFYLWMCLGGSRRQRQRSFGWFVVTLGAWGVAIAALNHYRFGSIIASGYGNVAAKFSTPVLTGLYGLVLSLNKGIVFYAPLSLLVPWSLWKLRRQNRNELAFFAAVFAMHVLLISKWNSWEGGASWGPRLLMPVIPLMVVCAAMLLDSGRWSIPVFASCVIAGILINLLGVLMNFLVWLNAVDTNRIRLPLEIRGRPAREYVEHDGKRWFRPDFATNYIPALSPILGHAWLLRLRYWGVPFRLNRIEADGSTPVASYPPVEIDLGSVKDSFFQSHLRSAHFWLYETVTRQPREEIFTYPIYGISIERQGDRAMTKGEGERAVECYTRAVELVPNYASPALKLSRLQVERGRMGEGVETLRRYLSRGNRNRDQERAVRLQLAQIYEKAGYREAALEQFRAYLTLQPSEENQNAIERHIRELSGAHP